MKLHYKSTSFYVRHANFNGFGMFVWKSLGHRVGSKIYFSVEVPAVHPVREFVSLPVLFE